MTATTQAAFLEQEQFVFVHQHRPGHSPLDDLPALYIDEFSLEAEQRALPAPN
jgi:hypothetical protein